MNIIKILGIAAGVAFAGLAGLSVTNPGNSAETSEDAKNESLKTRYYQVDFETFVEETNKLIPTMTTYGQNWRLVGGGGGGRDEVDSYESHYSTTVYVEVPVALFTDDLTIDAVKESQTDKIKVNLHSQSRVGKSDLGENKRHILQLIEALDKRFNR